MTVISQDYIRKSGEFKSVGNVDLLFSSERCVISEAAFQLMELVHQTLKVSDVKQLPKNADSCMLI